MDMDPSVKSGEEAGRRDDVAANENLHALGTGRLGDEGGRAERQATSLGAPYSLSAADSTKSYVDRLATQGHSNTIAHTTHTLSSGQRLTFPRSETDFKTCQGEGGSSKRSSQLSKDDSHFETTTAWDKRGRKICLCPFTKSGSTSPIDISSAIVGEHFVSGGESPSSPEREGSEAYSMEVFPKSDHSDISGATEDLSPVSRAEEWPASVPCHRSDPAVLSLTTSPPLQPEAGGVSWWTSSQSMVEMSPTWADTLSLTSSPAASSGLERRRSTSDGAATVELLQAGDTSRLPSSLAGLGKPLRNTAHVLHWMTQTGGCLKFPSETSATTSNAENAAIRSDHPSLDEISTAGHVSYSDGLAVDSHSHHTTSLTERECSSPSPSKRGELVDAEDLDDEADEKLVKRKPVEAYSAADAEEREAVLMKKFLPLKQLQICLNHLDGSDFELPKSISMEEIVQLLAESYALWSQNRKPDDQKPTLCTLDIILLSYFRSLLQSCYCHCQDVNNERLQLACGLMDAFAQQAEQDHLHDPHNQSYSQLLGLDDVEYADLTIAETTDTENLGGEPSRKRAVEFVDADNQYLGETDEDTTEPISASHQGCETQTDSENDEEEEEETKRWRKSDLTGNAFGHLPTVIEEAEETSGRSDNEQGEENGDEADDECSDDDQIWAARLLQLLEKTQVTKDLDTFQQDFFLFVESMVQHGKVSPMVAEMLSVIVDQTQRAREPGSNLPLSAVWKDFVNAFLALARALAHYLGPDCVDPEQIRVILASIEAQHGDSTAAISIQSEDDGQYSVTTRDSRLSHQEALDSEDPCSAGDTKDISWFIPECQAIREARSIERPSVRFNLDTAGDEMREGFIMSSPRNKRRNSDKTKGNVISFEDSQTNVGSEAQSTAVTTDPDGFKKEIPPKKTTNTHDLTEDDEEDDEDNFTKEILSKKSTNTQDLTEDDEEDDEDNDKPNKEKQINKQINKQKIYNDDSDVKVRTYAEDSGDEPQTTGKSPNPPPSRQSSESFSVHSDDVGSMAGSENDVDSTCSDNSLYSEKTDDRNPARTASDAYLERLFCAAARIDPRLAVQSLGPDLSVFPSSIHSRVKIAVAKILVEVITKGTNSMRKSHVSNEGTNPRTRTTLASPRPNPSPRAERDVNEGQVKHLEMENAKLKSENKMIKEKLNHALCEVRELQERLSSTRESLDTLRSSVPREVAAAYQKSRSEADVEIEELQDRIRELTRANSTLRGKAEEFEAMFEEAKTEFDKLRVSSDHSKSAAAFKKEAACLQEQVRSLKELLKESEESLQKETLCRRESEEQLMKIHNIKELLQAEVDKGESMGTAEKRVRGLEKRLQITEERLHQERADRAANLSQVEEKLLTENAQLRAQEKELTRQLQRERDKARNLTTKSRDLKEEIEKLKMALPLEDAALFDRSVYDLPHSLHSSQRQDSKKTNAEWKRVLGEVETALMLGEGEEKQMVMTLWAQRQQSAKRLKDLENRLQALDIEPEGDLAAGLKSLQQQREELQALQEAMEEKMKNLRSEKDTAIASLEKQLSVLVREKHEAVARVRSMEDVVEAVRGENEVLRSSLGADPSLDPSLQRKRPDGSQEKIQELSIELQSARAQVAQLQRSVEALTEENRTLQAQLDARERALEEAMNDANSVASREDYSSRLREKLSACNAELKSMQSELTVMVERNKSLGSDKVRLSMELEECHAELNHLRDWQRERRVTEEVDAKKIRRLEAAISQKDDQLMKLSVAVQELNLQHGRLKDINEFNQIHMDELENQLEDVRQQLLERSKLLKNTTNRDKEQMDQIFVLQQMVDHLAHELRQKDAELKNVDMELGLERDRMERLERRVSQVGLDMSKNANDGVDSGTQIAQDNSENAGGSCTHHGAGPCHPCASMSLSLRLEDLEGQRDRLKREIQAATKKLQSLESEFILAQQSLTRVSQDLVEERSLNKRFATEKNCLECQLKALQEERNALATQRSQAENDLERMEAKLRELMSRMEETAQRSTERISQCSFMKSDEPEMMEIELSKVHAYVEEKDKEVECLKDKIRRLETERNFMDRRLEVLKKENVASKEDINRITADLMIKMQENWAVFEMNQGLVRERHELQKQLEALSLDIKCEREYNEKRVKQLENNLKQSETEREKLRVEKEELQVKIGNLEWELKKAQLAVEEAANYKRQKEMEMERAATDLKDLKDAGPTNPELQAECEQLRQKNHELMERIAFLQQQIDELQRDLAETQRNIEYNRVADTEQSDRQAKEAFKLIEDLRRDRNALCKNLTEERKISADCQAAMKRNEEQIAQLTSRIEGLLQDYALMDQRLQEAKDLNAQLEEEKNAIAREYENVASRLAEIFLEKQQLEKLLDEMRSEDLHGRLQEMEKEFEHLTIANLRLKEELGEMPKLQMRLEQLEINNRESLILLESIRGEMVTMSEANSNLQDQLTQANAVLEDEREHHRLEREEHKSNIQRLNQTIAQIQTTSECEHRLMQDNICKMEDSRRHTEEALEKAQLGLNESMVELRSLNREVQELRGKLHTEEAQKEDLVCRLDDSRAEIENLRARKIHLEEMLMESEAAISKMKEEVQEERRVRVRLCQEKQHIEAVRDEENKICHHKTEENLVLKNEVNELQKLLECSKNQFESRTKKTYLQLKSQIENLSQEKVKLSQQAHKLSIELEQQREQVAIKHRENLQRRLKLVEDFLGGEEQKEGSLQEALLSLQNKVREADVGFKACQESLKMEEDLHHKTTSRCQEQEEEIKKLKHMLRHRLEEEANKADKEHWAELHRMMSELSSMLNKHGGESGKDMGRRLAEVECKLTTERRLHDITKASLQALEADCARLRKQMHQLHRKGHAMDCNFNRSPKRMDEINDIIARCQSRVSMTTDFYTDGTLRHLSPTKDFNLTPATQFSPDNSIGSDCSLSSRRSLPVASVVPRDSYNAGF